VQGSRIDRVSSLIQEVLSELLNKDVKDPRVEWPTVTGVRVSPDLRTAKVYISTIKGEERLAPMLTALNNMRGFLQKRLNEKIRLKYIPVLYFYPDRNIPYAFEIMEKIKEVLPDSEKENDE